MYVLMDVLVFLKVMAMDEITNQFAAPMDWYLSLPWWGMAGVALGGILVFYTFLRLIAKIVELIAGIFN